MPKMAVIADAETTLGFKAVGVDDFPYAQQNELKAILAGIKDRDYSVVLIDEDAYGQLKEDLKSLEEAFAPAVVIIPSAGRKIGIAETHMKEIVQKAVGVKIGD